MVRDLVTLEARARPISATPTFASRSPRASTRAAENGDAKGASDDCDHGPSASACWRATPWSAPGYFGRGLGAADIPDLERVLEAGLDAAYRRAMANAEGKAQARGKFGPLGRVARRHAPRIPSACAATPCPRSTRSTRGPWLAEMTRFTPRDLGARSGPSTPRLGYNYVSTMTQLARELFASSEGALIDQSFALTQGLCYVVGTGRATARRSTTSSATSAAGRSSTDGVNEPVMSFPPFADFALGLARDAVELAPPRPSPPRATR